MNPDDVIRIVITAENQVGPGVNAARRDLDNFYRGATEGANNFGNAMRNAAGMAQSALNSLLGIVRGVIGGVLDLARTIVTSLISAFQNLIDVATKAGVVIGGVVAAGFAAVAKTGVDMNISLQTAKAGLTAITGSAQAADRFIAQLQETAANTGPTFKELLPLGQQLLSVFRGDGDQAIKTIKALDAAVKVLAGGSTEAFARAQLAISQMAGGDLHQEEINQLREALPGFDIRGILQRQFGTADSETLQKAGVTGMQVARALVQGMETQFAQSSKDLAKSIPLALSGIQDAFNALSGRVTQGLTASLERALNAVRTLIEGLAQNRSLMEGLATIFDLAGKAIEYAASQLPVFVDWLTKIVTKENVIQFLSNVAAFFKTLYDNVVNFISVATAGKGIGSIWEAFGKAAETALDFVVRAWNGFTSVVSYFVQNSGKLWEFFLKGINAVVAGIEVLAGAIVVLAGATVLGKLIGGLTQVIQLAGALRGLAGLGGAAGAIGGLGGGAAGQIFSPQGALGGLGAAAGAMIPTLGAFGGQGAAGAALRGLGLGNRPATRENVMAALQAAAAAGAAAATGGGAAGGVQFGGVLGGLQGIGQGVLGTAGGLGAGVFGMLPTDLQGFLSGAGDAWRRGFGAPGSGVSGFSSQFGANRAAIEGVLRGVLGGAPGAAQAVAAGVAPPHQLGAGSATGAGPAGVPDAKAQAQAVRDYWAAQREFWRWQQEIARENERQAKEAARAAEEARRAQEQAIRQAIEQARESARAASELADARLDFQAARIGADPRLSGRQRALLTEQLGIERFAGLARPVPHETERERLRRMTSALGVQRELLQGVAARGGNVMQAFQQLMGIGAQAGQWWQGDEAPGARARMQLISRQGGAAVWRRGVSTEGPTPGGAQVTIGNIVVPRTVPWNEIGSYIQNELDREARGAFGMQGGSP